MPTLSGLLTGAGIMTIFLQALNYLIDAYLMVAASAIAANTFLRSFFGAGFRKYSPFLLPGMRTNMKTALFATQMFHNLGVQWAGSLLGFLAVAFMPIPFLFYIYGERLRKTSSYAPTDFGKKPNANDEENREESRDNGEETTVEGEEMEGEREKRSSEETET